MYGDDFRVSFDVRRLGTYVISKTDLKAAEANLVEVLPGDGAQHNQHARPPRAHLSSASRRRSRERLEGLAGLFGAFACKERGLSHSFTASGLG